MIHHFTCDICLKNIQHESDISTGYGKNDQGQTVCFACCADQDRAEMRRTGKAVLYLNDQAGTSTVGNWSGTLHFPLTHKWTGKHNMAGTVTFFRFIGPDNAVWSGRNVGKWSQLARCKRTAL